MVPFKRINKSKFLLEKVVLLSSLILLILLPLNLSIKWDQVKETSQTPNIQILFDVSLSTVSSDVYPSRSHNLKQALSWFVSHFHWYNIGIITYSSLPFNWTAFSDQTDSILAKIQKLNLSEFPPTIQFVGTAVGDAIYLWIDNILRLYEEQQESNIMVIFTDANFNEWADRYQAAEFADRQWIRIYWIWIGQEATVVWKDRFSGPVTGFFRFDELQTIAESTGGQAFDIHNEYSPKHAFEQIQSDLEDRQFVDIKYELISLNKYIYILLSILFPILIFIRFYVLLAERE